GQPPDLDRYQDAGRATWAPEIECVARLQVAWIDLVGTHLHIAEAGKVDLDPRCPLTHGPVVPVTAHEVARLRPAEGEIQEFAGKGREILALTEFTDLPVELAVEVLLVVPEVGKSPGLAATIQLLHLLQVAEMGIVTQVAPVAIGDRHDELRVLEPEELLQ